MEPSLAGIIVCAGLLLFGAALGSPLVYGLFASLAFGSTAIVKLTALGGSSPLVFTVFVAALLARLALAKDVADDLASVLWDSRAAQVVCILTVYAVASALLMPRLFAGETNALVVVEGMVVEVPLAPSSGNITQTAYFVLGALVFLAFCVLLQRHGAWKLVQRGFFVFATVHAALGVIDVGGKALGAGDVMEPIRSAGYALLVDVVEHGFWRIVGGHAEASSFAAYTLPALAFSFMFWKTTGSYYALGLSFVLLVLLVFSTSTTAYAGFAIAAALFLASLALTAIRGQLRMNDLVFFAIAWVALALALAAYLYNEQVFDPLASLLDSVVFNKQSSFSGQERAYWNAMGIEAFRDTYGLGVGMGSSRSSSWMISVLSQLGIVGTLMMGVLVLEVFRGVGGRLIAPRNFDIMPLFESVRAAVVAWLAAISISFGSADPGLIFFIGLATLVSIRAVAARRAAPAHMAA